LTASRPRCSEQSRVRKDQVGATASHVRNWLLLEQPGAWGSDAILESRLPRTVARDLHEMGRRLGIRIVLIRRPDRRPEGRNVYLAHTGGRRTAPLLIHGVLDDPAALLEFDLHPLTAGRPVGFGRAVDAPLFLVCTNGRHDVCCAERGRPLYRALTPEFPEETWECSHIGGDRFAGNLICFPHGAYFGWVEPLEVVAIARSYADGILDLLRYRGRSSWSIDIQAAEHFVRMAHGIRGVESLLPERRVQRTPTESEVTIEAADGRRYTAVVRRDDSRTEVLTCTASEPAPTRHFELVSLAMS
jgi:hypothetical protein